jgi:hypothetical protein
MDLTGRDGGGRRRGTEGDRGRNGDDGVVPPGMAPTTITMEIGRDAAAAVASRPLLSVIFFLKLVGWAWRRRGLPVPAYRNTDRIPKEVVISRHTQEQIGSRVGIPRRVDDDVDRSTSFLPS